MKPWAKPTGMNSWRQFSRDNSTATWRPKVDEERRRSTATSRMRPWHHAHELVLGERRGLVMQSADRADIARQRVIVLHELVVKPGFRPGRGVVRLAEKAALVAELSRRHELQTFDFKILEQSRSSLSIS